MGTHLRPPADIVAVTDGVKQSCVRARMHVISHIFFQIIGSVAAHITVISDYGESAYDKICFPVSLNTTNVGNSIS